MFNHLRHRINERFYPNAQTTSPDLTEKKEEQTKDKIILRGIEAIKKHDAVILKMIDETIKMGHNALFKPGIPTLEEIDDAFRGWGWTSALDEKKEEKKGKTLSSILKL